MSLIKYRKVKNLINTFSVFAKSYSQSTSVVVSEVKYPPVLDVTPEGILRHTRQLFYDRVKSLSTAEEKLYEISAHQNPKHRIYYVSSAAQTATGVPFQQYITRTHLIHGLPQKYEDHNVDQILSELEPYLFREVVSQFNNRWRSGTNFQKRLLNGLISLIYRKLFLKNDFLHNCTLDSSPRIFSYWWHGGFFSKKKKLQEENICFQYHGHPTFAVRTRAPLCPIVPLDDPLCTTASVIDCNYVPSTHALPYRIRQYLVNVPGFWPGDPCEYPFVAFHPMDNISELKAKLDNIENLHPTIEDGFGIMSSFAWLHGIAMYQGFTQFHDITYPLVTQTVITDGQDWYFFVYQLNTICFHADVDLKNKRNICWSSGKLRLFEAIENGELKGVDNSVFKVLLKFFLNSPEVPSNVELKPYLSTTPTKSPEEFQEMKVKLLKMFSNRPDPRAHLHEVPLWQHVYKWHKDAPPSPSVRLQ